MTDHPGAHGGEHFFALGGVEEFGFFYVVIAAALFAVLVVVLAAVGVGDEGFVAGFFVGGVRVFFVCVHQ